MTSVVQLASSRANHIYIAGPMTGLPNYNFDAFNGAAAMLRAGGKHVENPAEHGVVEEAKWEDYLHYDIGRLVTCEAIALLPGWSNSNGAKLEFHIAKSLGMKIHYLNGAEEIIYEAVSHSLKPCPFCSGSVSFHQDPDECKEGCHSIICPKCGTFDLSFAADPENKCETLDSLRKAIVPCWNARDEVVALKKERDAAKVMVLRLKTDFTMMDCKKALFISDGDMAKAETYLRSEERNCMRLVTYARK